MCEPVCRLFVSTICNMLFTRIYAYRCTKILKTNNNTILLISNRDTIHFFCFKLLVLNLFDCNMQYGNDRSTDSAHHSIWNTPKKIQILLFLSVFWLSDHRHIAVYFAGTTSFHFFFLLLSLLLYNTTISVSAFALLLGYSIHFAHLLLAH